MSSPPDAAAPDNVEFLRAFGKIGLLSFGGPAAQIAVMQRVVIDERRWIGERDFLVALSFCMLLPGPEAMQLATWLGWRLRGTLGGVVAGLLFVLPGAVVVMMLAWLYWQFESVSAVSTLFLGVKAAVIAIVLAALIKLSKRTLSNAGLWAVAVVTFVAMYAFAVPFPVIVLSAGILGLLFPIERESTAVSLDARQTLGRTMRTASVWLAIWWLPLIALYTQDSTGVLWEVGRFFSVLAVLSFGGAYAVLSWLAQDAVLEYGWLTTAQMMDGLGLAETTPGPLILVTEFVGFLAGAGEGGVLLGVGAAAVTLWATFVPCFLWIFVGAPWLSWISAQPRLAGMLRTISAAVVGVMASLSLWFAVHAMFAEVALAHAGIVRALVPNLTSLSPAVLGLTAFAVALVFGMGWGAVRVLVACCAAAAALLLF